MRSVGDVLSRALRTADQEGRVTVRLADLPASDASDLVRHTHDHALRYAVPGPADGWLLYHDGIRGWWSDVLNMSVEEVVRRLAPLRADVKKRLEDEGLVKRPHPGPRRSTFAAKPPTRA